MVNGATPKFLTTLVWVIFTISLLPSKCKALPKAGALETPFNVITPDTAVFTEHPAAFVTTA